MFKIHRVAKWIKNTRPFNMLPTRDSLHGERHTETESEGMEKDIPCKRKSKESWSSNSYKIK